MAIVVMSCDPFQLPDWTRGKHLPQEQPIHWLAGNLWGDVAWNVPKGTVTTKLGLSDSLSFEFELKIHKLGVK